MTANQSPAKIPTLIEPYGASELLLGWNDGEQHLVSYSELRFRCPCAVCVDELTGKRVLKRESVSADVRPTQVDPVGRYAIQFRWSDGHSTGIYSYDGLLEACHQAGRRIRAATG